MLATALVSDALSLRSGRSHARPLHIRRSSRIRRTLCATTQPVHAAQPLHAIYPPLRACTATVSPPGICRGIARASASSLPVGLPRASGARRRLRIGGRPATPARVGERPIGCPARGEVEWSGAWAWAQGVRAVMRAAATRFETLWKAVLFARMAD